MTLNQFYRKYSKDIDKAIASALKEDRVKSDISTQAILKRVKIDRKIEAILLCKEDCIAAGIDIFIKVYKKLDPKAEFKVFFRDGEFVRNKKIVLTVKSTLRNLLAGERTALNFVQKMSGVATTTNFFVKKLKFKGSRILHTRKTTPNFRIFELAAVKIGGGDFHRLDLSSAILVKDNHIKSAGSIENALRLLKNLKNGKRTVEIEVKNNRELQSVLNYGKVVVRTVMLDNFRDSELNNAVRKLKELGFKVELSGGITNENFTEKQRKGIDYYSIGMLTHSYESIDFSLEF